MSSLSVIVTESGHSAATEGAGAGLKYLRTVKEMTIDQTELTLAPGQEGLSPHTEQIGGQFPSPSEREGDPPYLQSCLSFSVFSLPDSGLPDRCRDSARPGAGPDQGRGRQSDDEDPHRQPRPSLHHLRPGRDSSSINMILAMTIKVTMVTMTGTSTMTPMMMMTMLMMMMMTMMTMTTTTTIMMRMRMLTMTETRRRRRS